MIEFNRISAKKLKRFVCTDISSMRKTRTTHDSWLYSEAQAYEITDSPYSEFSMHKLLGRDLPRKYARSGNSMMIKEV